MATHEPDKNGMSSEGDFLNAPFFCSVIALVLSSFGIICVLSSRAYLSFSLILLAVIFDMLDGALSRKLHLESTFGALFDLLQDCINYLMYPTILFNDYRVNADRGVSAFSRQASRRRSNIS